MVPAEPDITQRHRRGSDPETAIKNLAKTLARDSTAAITDRHVRAEVRTTCYNQVVNVLLQLEAEQVGQRQRFRKVLTGLSGTAAVLAVALVACLLI